MALYTMEQLKNEHGVTRTQGLFLELSYSNQTNCIFTMREDDYETSDGRPLMSLSKKFIELTVDDPTEVLFADTVFGSWNVWERISTSHKKIVAAVAQWRKEAIIRRKSIAFQTLVNEVRTQGKQSLTSAKYLIEEPWIKGVGKDGRKHRKESAETAQEAFEREGLSEDLERLKEGGLIQ